MEPTCRPSMEQDVEPLPMRRLGVEADLSRRCRRDSYCVRCLRAFCSHCCRWHHANTGFHAVIPIAVDGDGHAIVPRCYPGSTQPIQDNIAALIAAEDYATPLPADAYCFNCMVPFCSAACHHC
ncbi:hypothetical protein ACP70R_026401 [Stipagrostis hirtigluma subsp. patula]